MYKQVIVVNKSLNMSPGKLGAMVAHGATSFFCEWFKRNVVTSNETYNDYLINPNARVDKELFAQWISGSFTKIVLEVEDDAAMKAIIKKVHKYGMVNRQDFFNIVDESTEFLDIPQWAVIAFRPMEAEKIDPITGDLSLYSKDLLDINEVLGEQSKNIFLVSKPNMQPGESTYDFWFFLAKNKSKISALSNGYRLVNLSTGTVLAKLFATREEAITWAVSRDWKVESVGEKFSEIK